MFMIKEMPILERPRERFIEYGAEKLQTYELIAIILRTGSTDLSVIELSKNILYHFQTLKELSSTAIKDLIKIKGIGPSKAIQLLAAFELGKRTHTEAFLPQTMLNRPEKVFQYMKTELELKTQEQLVALYLNTKGELIKKKTLFVGSLNSSLIHPREIFKYAVIFSAASIVLVHNHPSGDPTPSSQDLDITKRIYDNSLMMDIQLVDHIIIGRDRYYSFKEHRQI